jgi:hypothetical protein
MANQEKNATEKQWTTIERLGEGKGATIDFQSLGGEKCLLLSK